ncbi:hypothetical protein B0H14DRAFT_3126171 [Mycena olivaceomarginata]|nr:hypothetical protein B0H14DRAFT_3126171 [Mycena olivaceomarginata]
MADPLAPTTTSESIWLLLILCMGPKAMLVSRRYLAALDSAAFECLAPWFMFNADDIIPAHPLHPFNQFLINIMDIQPSMIQSPRTQEVCDNWTILFMSEVLLNRTDVFGHPEFITLRRGINITMGSTSFIAQLGGLNGALRVFAAMYNLKRYLGRVGHPTEVRGTLVDEDEWCKRINDSALYAHLLLHAASDSDQLPSSDTWRLKFRFVGINTISTVNEPNPRPLNFHTCTYEVDVKISEALEDLLLLSCVKLDDPNYTTPFDLWFHGQLLSRDHNTA